MSGKKRNIKTFLTIVGGVTVLLTAATIASFVQPESYPPYSSQSPSPTGTKAFYTYMKKENQVSRWNNHPNQLANVQEEQLLLMVEPAYTLGKAELEPYKQWMRKGNTIWLMIEKPSALFNTKSISVNPATRPVEVQGLSNETNSALVPSTTRLRLTEGDEALLTDERGVIALRRSYGKGELIVSITPNWVMNSNIVKQDHPRLLDLLLKEAGTGNILFDEYIHGEGNLPNVFSIYPLWIIVIALQTAVIAILWLWMKGKRFGPIYTPRSSTVRFGDERIQALASWYVRSGFYYESIRIQEQYLRTLIRERWGISLTASWEEVCQSLSAYQTEAEQHRWQHLTSGMDQLDQPKSITKSTYLSWCKTIDQLRKEVHKT